VAGLAVMAQFLDPSNGPDQTGGFQVSPTYFIVLFFAGILAWTLGNLYKAKTLQVIGALFVLMATLFIPLYLAFTH
jgi:hypothetical protein